MKKEKLSKISVLFIYIKRCRCKLCVK